MNAAFAPSFDAPFGFELRFRSLFDEGRGLSFPCDQAGRVDVERLSERARRNLQRAQALVGRDFSTPAVQPTLCH